MVKAVDNLEEYFNINYTAQDILDGREERVEFLENLIIKYNKPVLVVRVNYPGIKKNNKMSCEIIGVIKAIILDKFKDQVVFKSLQNTAEGPIFTAVINNNALYIKKATIEIEETHALGRCVDIDVYDENNDGISRDNLGYERRKCFICGEYAHTCVRARRHSENETIGFIKKQLQYYYIDSGQMIGKMVEEE